MCCWEIHPSRPVTDGANTPYEVGCGSENFASAASMKTTKFPHQTEDPDTKIEISVSPPTHHSRLPISEDLARREKAPFVMTSLGRANKRILGWEVGPTMEFSPGEPG